MPNGGLGHCGGCLFNMRLLLEEAFKKHLKNPYKDAHFGINPEFCTLRKVLIPNCGYTYCANATYDDFDPSRKSVKIPDNFFVKSMSRIKGTIWVHENKRWHRKPHDNIEWNLDEWKRWNEYVSLEYPHLISEKWIKNVDVD